MKFLGWKWITGQGWICQTCKRSWSTEITDTEPQPPQGAGRAWGVIPPPDKCLTPRCANQGFILKRPKHRKYERDADSGDALGN